MVTRIELDALLGYLRQELERIDEAIIALEQMAFTHAVRNRNSRALSRQIADSPASGANSRKNWSTHRAHHDS